ncbi:NAD(+)/NADH kinase, partial [Pseudoalteromonas sp. AC163]
MAFKLGLIVNPVAGLGGTVALKGSDGAHTAAKAIELGAEPKANSRTKAALEVLLPYKERLTIYTVNGDMGEQTAKALGFNVEVVYNTSAITTPDDTEQAAKILKNSGVDLVLFAGGDGTARNICHAIEDTIPVLGIPAGCKIHSGVYAITPKAAGRVVEMLVKGELVTLADADVMDIDEDAFRQGTVKAKRYGEMQTPSEVRYMQAVKNGGKETDELVLADIAAHVVSQMDEDTFYIMGSG